MIRSEEARNHGTVDLDRISEGEAILADRACKRLFKMSLKEINRGLIERGITLSRQRFDALVETGALSCSCFENNLSEQNTIQTRIRNNIERLEGQIYEYKESLRLLETRNNKYAWD